MTPNARPLTGDSSIGTWLDDPIGGPIVRELLAQGGQDAGRCAQCGASPSSDS